MIESLLVAIEEEKKERLRLEVRGSNPIWSDEFTARMTKTGKYGERLLWDEVDGWLRDADILLTAMSFDPAQKRQVETSFPSKLAHYSRLGMPLIIWGPNYCSATRWALASKGCLCITNPDPKAVIEQIVALKPEDFTNLSALSSDLFHQYFRTETITEKFYHSLRQSCQSLSHRQKV
jgi:hypothetical protein